MSDTITILNSLGPLMAKTFLADGSVKNYDRARNFRHDVRPVTNIDDVYLVLGEISQDPTACAVRGTPAPDAPEVIERRLENLSDTAHMWVALDVDNFACDPQLGPVAQATQFILDRLPREFHDITYVLQLSSSYGFKPGFRGRLWFWLDKPFAWREIEAWAYWACADNAGVPYVDITVFRPAQVIYTACPKFEGTPDPVTEAGWPRVQLVRGWAGDVVDLLPAPDDWVRERQRRVDAGSVLSDPLEKGGVVGAWCRHAVDMPTAVECYLAEHIETVTERRCTWLGGNSPEGAFITHDNQHLVITNSTFRLSNSAMNAFDACRVLLFGDQDPAYRPGQDVTALPSYRAMLAFVRDEAKLHPGLAEELAELSAPSGPSGDEAFGGLDDDAGEEDSQTVSDRPRQPTRADQLAAIQVRLAELNDTGSIEVYVTGLAAGDWLDSERAQIAAWAQARGAALAGRGAPDLRTVKGWLKRQAQAPQPGTAPVAVYPHMTATVPSRPKNTLDNIRVLLSSRGLRLVYDEISKEQYLQDANGRRMSLGELSSLANEDDFTPTWAASTAQGWLRSMPAGDWVSINPALDWVRSRAWDGVPRIEKLAETLVLEDPTPENVHRRNLYVRKWCLQAVAMLLSTGNTQARGVLTIVGKQNLGKTRWVSSLAPGWTGAGNADMLHSKDGLIAATKMWICELAEIEGNTRKQDVTALKAFLTQKQDTFRRPYAAEAEDHIRRTVFVGSANAEELLADQTGNSRFWAIKVRAMDYEHGIDTQQVFAEALAALEAGEKHWFAAEETAIIDRGNRDFEMPDPMLDLIETKLDWAAPHDEWVFNRVSILCGSLLGRVPSRGDAIAFGLAFGKACDARDLSRDWTLRRSNLGNLIRHPPVLRGGGLD